MAEIRLLRRVCQETPQTLPTSPPNLCKKTPNLTEKPPKHYQKSPQFLPKKTLKPYQTPEERGGGLVKMGWGGGLVKKVVGNGFFLVRTTKFLDDN